MKKKVDVRPEMYRKGEKGQIPNRYCSCEIFILIMIYTKDEKKSYNFPSISLKIKYTNLHIIIS